MSSKFARFESSDIKACGKYCKRRCTKHAWLILSYQWHHWRIAAAMTTWSSLAHSVLSRRFSSFRSVMRILYIFSCNAPTRCSQLDSNLANLGATIEVEWILEFLPNNPMVAHVRWAFQVSQGSVETFYIRWKTFTSFCSTFIQESMYQTLLESTEFYRRFYKKNILVSFFLDCSQCMGGR